jgi:hypothetical protein
VARPMQRASEHRADDITTDTLNFMMSRTFSPDSDPTNSSFDGSNQWSTTDTEAVSRVQWSHLDGPCCFPLARYVFSVA